MAQRGLFNSYREGMPITEVWIKDLHYALGSLVRRIKNGGKKKVIISYPDYPSKKTTLHKIAKTLDYNLTNKQSDNAKCHVYWEDVTHGTIAPFLKQVSGKVLNSGITDISKVKVDKVHQAVFGYATEVDPSTHKGKAVEKSDINAKHDGKIVDCPLNDVEEQKIYQILIDNQHDDEYVVDIRVPYVAGLLDFAYLKYRKIEVRFTNQSHHVEIKPLSELLSHQEQEQIHRFCEAMRLDFGELDVLRHKGNGKIYVVDINKTPYGPPATISKQDSKFAVRSLSMAFESAFLK